MCHTRIRNRLFFPSISCSCQYSSLVNDHEGDCAWIYNMQSYMGVCVCLHALALLLYLRINPGSHLCLCVPCHACDCVFMYQTKPICIQLLLPVKSFIHLPAYSTAPGPQLCTSSWVAQPSPGFPRNLALFIMHGTPLDYCRHRTLHHHSLQREAETDRKMGSGFKKTPIRMGYPIGWLSSELFFAPLSNISMG